MWVFYDVEQINVDDTTINLQAKTKKSFFLLVQILPAQKSNIKFNISLKD